MQIKKINDKRGFLLGEYTLKVIIAVLCLSLLLYLLVKFYDAYQSNSQINLAKASLKDIEEKMSLAKTSGEIQKSVLLSPAGSVLKAYQKGQQRPAECLENCLCLTFKDGWVSKKTICEEVSGLVLVKRDLILPVDISIKLNGDLYEINEYVQ
jgi:D-serine dehydratase